MQKIIHLNNNDNNNNKLITLERWLKKTTGFTMTRKLFWWSGLKWGITRGFCKKIMRKKKQNACDITVLKKKYYTKQILHDNHLFKCANEEYNFNFT